MDQQPVGFLVLDPCDKRPESAPSSLVRPPRIHGGEYDRRVRKDIGLDFVVTGRRCRLLTDDLTLSG